jgi:glyoxylase-like metal-dependent hydrolase (beta-lactamase superfamily II)
VPSYTFTGITNCFLIGEPGSDTLIVDPSPKDETVYANLKDILEQIRDFKDFKYSGIFITHSHGDHHQHAPELAREYSLPVIISENSHRRILSKSGGDYFKGIEVKHAKEGDKVIRWNGLDVNVYEIPGHDEGHLGLAPQGMDWFLAGDLIQGVGTVVIGKEEGNMAKYFNSLKRVIELNPKYVMPSHGGPQPSVKILKKTLNHRIKREKQVLKLFKRGKTTEQMVEIIYKGVDQRLWPLALMNIEGHLEKLKQEKIIP